jgi:hypothetical protein
MMRGLVVALGLVGCGQDPLETNGIPSHTLTIKAGRDLEVTPGMAVIVFQHTAQGPTVEDTINVH